MLFHFKGFKLVNSWFRFFLMSRTILSIVFIMFSNVWYLMLIFIYFLYQISTYPIDPDSRQRLSDEIDKLFIESHYLTITSELVTPQLLKLEQRKKKREKENVQHIKQDVSIPSAIEEKKPDKPRQKQNEAKKQLPLLSNSATEKRKIRTIKKVKLVPVRLKSGEVLKATQDLLIHFRQKVAGSANNPEKSQVGDINVFKIQSDALSRVIHVPFTDRLSPALKRLSAPKFTASTPLKRLNGHQSPLKNGKVHKPLKLRAALDKSTIAWSSTTKTRPKASLLDQLNSLAKKPVKTDFTEIRTEIPSVYKDTTLKNTTSPAQKPLNVVPVVIKLKKKAHSNKLLPLSQALKFIASDTLNLDAKMKNKMTNGDFSTPTT